MADMKQSEQTQAEPVEPATPVVDEIAEETKQADLATGSDSVEVVERETVSAGFGSLDDDLASANARADENWDRVIRMQAEMDNLRKRNVRELENAHKFALENIATELLAVRDSLEGAIEAGGAADVELGKATGG